VREVQLNPATAAIFIHGGNMSNDALRAHLVIDPRSHRQFAIEDDLKPVGREENCDFQENDL
jgi:hypothetical protein